MVSVTRRRLAMWMAAAMVACRQARAFSNHNVRCRVASPLTVAFGAVTDKGQLESQIKAKGDEIRALKEGGADKSTVAPLIEELLALKAKLEFPKGEAKKEPTKTESDDESESDFITARSVDYSKWYNDLIRVTGLAENSPVRGCMVIKPWGMALWDRIRTDLDARIQEHGAENAYFPLLIPKSFLSKEAEHVDGFAKECAVVTHHRLTAGEDGGLTADPDAKLEDPLIIRPTSETMIWYMFRKWINSHRYEQISSRFARRYQLTCPVLSRQ